jgi:tetratricopeptide (TPR) repeat protein
MILGILYLRSKETGRFFSRRTIMRIFCVEVAAALIVSAFLYVPARVPYLAEILVCRYRDDWTSHHNTKMSALASEIMRCVPEDGVGYGWSHGICGDMNVRERKYAEAIADYGVAIRLCPKEFTTGFYYHSRGEAKLASGDLSGALEDLDKAIALGHIWGGIYYDRGFAHEKLGNIESALADYDRTIAWANRFLEKPLVVSAVPRAGYDEESRRRVHKGNHFGYVITLEELVEIRERLAGTLPPPEIPGG